jgi:GH43 family beta-xylosidase
MKYILTLTRYTLLFFIINLGGCDGGSENTNNNPVPEDKTLFSNPVLTNGADPWIIRHSDNNYYLTHTTGNSIKIYRTTDPSQVSNGFSSTVWTAPPTGNNSKNIWAPEIHFIDNKWYAYYAADDGDNVNHRMWVLENSSASPFGGTWVDKGELELPDDKWAIDGTLFENEGQLYYTWSGWEGDINVQQNIYIVKMSDPLTPVGPRVKISAPELSWERNGGPPYINEAPQFLTHGDRVFIIYSASGCWTDDYALGLLSANRTADLANPQSWSKTPQPVFQKNAEAQAFGPGHNSFFKSPDGSEDWIIYHANSSSGQGCGSNRSIRMQPFAWKADETPDFGIPAALNKRLKRPSGEN